MPAFSASLSDARLAREVARFAGLALLWHYNPFRAPYPRPRAPHMETLYRLLAGLAAVLAKPYYLRRARRREPARNWRAVRAEVRERYGIIPKELFRAAPAAQAPTVWVHAVSVGEVLAAKPLLDAWVERFPTHRLFVSTTTETGRQMARERLASACGVFYFPLDAAFAARRALRAIRPALVVIMETEIWPNFLRESEQERVPVVFANARISERSFRRFRRWRWLIRATLKRALAKPKLFLAQTEDDAARLRVMGAPAERIEVMGNLKFDSEPPPLGQFAQWLQMEIGAQERWPVVVAGSVIEGEEESVLAAYDFVQRKWRRALLVLAPRKPARFGAAAEIIEADGWRVVRRSRVSTADPLDENADVLLLDSIGELAGLYALADAAFVGGSLVRAGGHNILEPAWFARPPVFGPHMENFRAMAANFLSARAGIQVSDGQELGRAWVRLIEDEAVRARMGEAARRLALRNRGATERSLDRVAALFPSWNEPS